MTDTTEQQAVTVAQEDREAAADLFCIVFPTDKSIGNALRRPNADGPWTQAFARHRLTSVSSASAEIPAGMKPWTGGDGAPDDWDGGSVLRADGQTEHSDDITIQQWKQPVPRCKWNIVAYTPARVLKLPEPVPATNQAGEVDVRARLQAKIRAGHCLDDSEDGDVNFCGECDWCLHILADRALATQPATSQEGEA